MNGTSIVLATGEWFDFDRWDDHRNVPSIEAIGHHLALTNRFSGATRMPYSVAEHSYRVARVLEEWGEDPRWGLMHDAAEAVLTDIPRPFKHYMLEQYRGYEAAVLETIAVAYGLPRTIPQAVHDADNVLLVTEARDLCPDVWPVQYYCDQLGVEPLDGPIQPVGFQMARDVFIDKWHSLLTADAVEAGEMA